MAPRAFSHFFAKEKELLRSLLAAGKARAEAARLLGRDLSTVARQPKLLKSSRKPATKGRPRTTTPKMAATLVTKAQALAKLDRFIRLPGAGDGPIRFVGLKRLLGAADFPKAGDRHAGLAAPDDLVREAARWAAAQIEDRERPAEGAEVKPKVSEE